VKNLPVLHVEVSSVVPTLPTSLIQSIQSHGSGKPFFFLCEYIFSEYKIIPLNSQSGEPVFNSRYFILFHFRCISQKEQKLQRITADSGASTVVGSDEGLKDGTGSKEQPSGICLNPLAQCSEMTTEYNVASNEV
jgi:hypothetical protein